MILATNQQQKLQSKHEDVKGLPSAAAANNLNNNNMVSNNFNKGSSNNLISNS